MLDFDKIWKLLETYGNNQTVAAIIGAIAGGLLVLFFTNVSKILALFGCFGNWLWAFLWASKYKDHAFEREYLTWLINGQRHLGLLPAQVISRKWGERQKFVELEEIYIRLSMSKMGGDDDWATNYGKKGEQSWRKKPSWGIRIIRFFFATFFSRFLTAEIIEKYPFLVEETYGPGDLGLAIDRHKRLIIRGDPGSGKTTLMRYLSVTCARARRKEQKDGDSSRLVKQRFLWDTLPFPIFVRLSRHGNVTQWTEDHSISDTFLEDLPIELRRKCPPKFFERHLERGNCLVLLDAFDELGSPQARNAMAKRITDFLYNSGKRNNRFVLTTRIIGYEGQLDNHGFHIRTVQDLNDGEVRALVKQRYKALTLIESLGRKEGEEQAIKQELLHQAEALLGRIEQNLRLRQLATNPMLLSLVVLVHYLKVELPDERVLLYRDCVEILAENWQKAKGLEGKSDLNLTQKTLLLRELAFAMQERRETESNLALITKAHARNIIAAKLPNFLHGETPQANEAHQFYQRKSEEWLASIQTESGILVERGLDAEGEPLIAFSHLTFQEYLTAVALQEKPAYQTLLFPNLLNPSWREVVRLYVALTNDATPVIQALLGSPAQPAGLLLAGDCLAERVKRVEPIVQQEAMAKLKTLFEGDGEAEIESAGEVLAAIRSDDLLALMRQHLNDANAPRQARAIAYLGQTRLDHPAISAIRNDLLALIESANSPKVIALAREALAQIGDPRFIGPEPMMVSIPAHNIRVLVLPDLKKAQAWEQKLILWGRNVRCSSFILWRIITGRRQIPAFEIGKYPITNLEYSRFVAATGHESPTHWVEGLFPKEEATHPVVTSYITDDAKAFCAWLSQQTGKKYRLPLEWEWELVACGPQKWWYPWGDQFDQNKCNTNEAGLERVTPVGSYPAGNSFYGVSDLSGNVWEMTTGLFGGHFLFLLPFMLLIMGLSLGLAQFLVQVLGLGQVLSLGQVSAPVQFLSLFLVLFQALFQVPDLVQVKRGGSWKSNSKEATCFYSFGSADATKGNIGFRVVREL